MGQTRTIVEMEQEVRRRADRPSTMRPTSGDVTAMLRESWRALYAVLVRADRARFLTVETVSVTSGTSSYALPAACWQVVGVAVQDTSLPSGWRPLDRYQWDERYDAPASADKSTARYEIRGSLLYLSPSPSWSGTVRVEYVPHASWTAASFASAPSTASTQATGAGATAWRVNCAARTVSLGSASASISAAADFSIHSATQLAANGQSCRARLVAKNVSGVISVVAVKGTAATTGTETAPSDATVQAAVGAGNAWLQLADVMISRTGDTTVTQTQDSVDGIDAANGVDEWLILDVVAKIKAADEEESGQWVGMRDAVTKRLLGDEVVDVARPPRIVDSRRRRAQWWLR